MNDALYVVTPDNRTYAVEEDGLHAARRIAELLFTHEWVELRREGTEPKTRWTVMRRNSSGRPELMAVEGWEGDVYVLSNERQP